MMPYPFRLISLALFAALGCTPTAPIEPAAKPAVTHQPRLWLAYGDSITDDAFRDPIAWQTALPGGQAINSGMRGATTTQAIAKLDEVLRAYPGVKHAGVAFGTNDAYLEMPVADFKANLRTLVQSLLARGIRPMLATIPYSPHPRMGKLAAYNAAVREVEGEFSLGPGPDLYQWFAEHPEQVSADQIHMTEAGSEAIQQLWAERVRGHWPPSPGGTSP